MAAINELIANLILAAPDCPEELAVAKYRDAARYFMRETQVWREEVSLSRYGHDAKYLLVAPGGAEVFDALDATYKGSPLTKASQRQLRARYKPDKTGVPDSFRFNEGLLHLAPNPGEDITDELSVLAALRPTREATELPDRIADEHGEVIEQGAIARLLTVPAQAWTDYSASRVFWAQFVDAIDRWDTRAADDGMRGVPRRVKYGGY